MPRISLFSDRIAEINDRISDLYRHVRTSPLPTSEGSSMPFVELEDVSKTLQAMMKEVSDQNELLKSIQADIERERWHSQRLLKLISDGYLVVNSLLQIQSINPAATTLLKLREEGLIGQSLLSLILEDDKAVLQERLSQLQPGERIELVLRFRQPLGQFLAASVVIEKGYNWQKKSVLFYVLLKDFVKYSHAVGNLEGLNQELLAHFPVQTYQSGDLIPIKPQRFWLVNQGIVKLSTLSEQGEELLIGLLGRSMTFGSSLTALQVYQAVALTEAQIISVPITNVLQSHQLMQTMLPLLIHRLQQTEKFLLIYGQMRIEDRFSHLLKLLKQEIGESTATGMRLAIRLTHQDLASACGTTRVTITRLLGKLQQEGKVSIDDKKHLILPS